MKKHAITFYRCLFGTSKCYRILQTLLAVASGEWVWAWQYRSAPKGASAAADAGAASTLKAGKEWKFRVDDVAARRSSSMDVSKPFMKTSHGTRAYRLMPQGGAASYHGPNFLR